MTDASWERLTEAIDVGAGIDRHGRETRPAEDRTDIQLKVEFFEFSRGGQKLRLERITGPAIVGRKSHYAKSGGGGVRFENIYDMNEEAHQVVLLRDEGGEWVEAPLDGLGIA